MDDRNVHESTGSGGAGSGGVWPGDAGLSDTESRGVAAAGSDTARDEATAPGYWQGIDRRRRTALVVSGLVVVLAAAGGLLAVVTGGPSPVGTGEATRTITPAEPTTESIRTEVGTYTLPAVPGDDGEAGTPGTPGAAAPGTSGTAVPGPPAPGASVAETTKRAPLVAYRRDGWLCVSAEDGSAETRIAESAAGSFALSPDGGALAWIDEQSKMLRLALVSGGWTAGVGSVKTVGPAEADTPAWAPDSAWLVYTAPGPTVTRVRRDGSEAARLFTGSKPSVSADGSVVVGASAAAVSSVGGAIEMWRDGTGTRTQVSGAVTALASDGPRVYFAIAEAEGTPSIAHARVDGGDVRPLVEVPASSRQVVFTDLILSPDGSRLIYAEHGDDGYSRVFVVNVIGGTPMSLALRRDCYPLGWSSDGASVFLIEGNALQGERTSLVRVGVPGGAREYVVQGAGL